MTELSQLAASSWSSLEVFKIMYICAVPLAQRPNFPKEIPQKTGEFDEGGGGGVTSWLIYIMLKLFCILITTGASGNRADLDDLDEVG